MALTDDFIKGQVKELLPVNSTIYDNQLNALIKGAKSKLKIEGVDNVFYDTEDDAYNYVICIAYQIAKDMDFDLDIVKIEEQYITRVNELRTHLLVRQSSN